MKKKPIDKGMTALVKQLKKSCMNAGIDNDDFGVQLQRDGKRRPYAVWYYPRTMADDNILIDLLDDLDGNNESVLEYKIEDFQAELSQAQELLFNEFEPKFATIRRIYHIQDQLDDLAAMVSQLL